MNMISVSKLIVTGFCLIMLPIPGYALTPGQVFEKVKNSVVVVWSLDVQGKITSQGSGVLISSGRVATNYHVVKVGFSYQVGQGERIIPVTIYAYDEKKDICILKADEIKGTPVQIGKALSLKVGDPVYTVGAPQGFELSLSDGVVAQLRGNPLLLIQTTAAISPGSSGGGLFDGEGYLVGLTTFHWKDGQSINFAVPADWISEIKPGRKQSIKGSRNEWFKQSLELAGKEDIQGLVDWGIKWTKSEPESGAAWATLGFAYRLLERYSEAIDAFRQVLRIDPDNDGVWLSLGDSYNYLKRCNDAIDALKQSLRINPNNAEAWRELGIAFIGLEHWEKAKEALTQSLRINPKDALTWANLGLVFNVQERYSEAIDALKQSLRIDPDKNFTWYHLGFAYRKLKRYSEANDALRQSLRIDPDNVEAWKNLIASYTFSGNKTAALKAIKELRRLDPATADRLFNSIMAQ